MLVYNKELVEGFTYIPLDQRGDAEPFKLTIRPISSRDLAKLQDNLLIRDMEDKISMRTGSYNLSVCKLSIIGWENMTDGDAKEIKMLRDADGRISDKMLDILPIRYFDEVAGVAVHVSQDPSSVKYYTDL